jgi:hypothetical protein
MENTRVKNLKGLQDSLYDVYNSLLINAIDNKDAMTLVSTANTIIKAEQTMFIVAKYNRNDNALSQGNEEAKERGTITINKPLK